jgi:hypothetical protein
MNPDLILLVLEAINPAGPPSSCFGFSSQAIGKDRSGRHDVDPVFRCIKKDSDVFGVTFKIQPRRKSRNL